jgi:hypothetical protein
VPGAAAAAEAANDVAEAGRRDHYPAKAEAMTDAARIYLAALMRLVAEAIIEPRLWPDVARILATKAPKTLGELLARL